MERLLAARSHNLLHVEFRKKAPHLLVVAPLESVTSVDAQPELFSVLQDLASCTLARRS